MCQYALRAFVQLTQDSRLKDGSRSEDLTMRRRLMYTLGTRLELSECSPHPISL
jgi:hypothetical protein